MCEADLPDGRIICGLGSELFDGSELAILVFVGVGRWGFLVEIFGIGHLFSYDVLYVTTLPTVC